MKEEIKNMLYLGMLILFSVSVAGLVWYESRQDFPSSEMFVKKQVIMIHENNQQNQ